MAPQGNRGGFMAGTGNLQDAGCESLRNSTSDTLSGAATFTGEAHNMSTYATVSVFCYSDVDSAIGGLSMEMSTDGTNWDRVKTITVAGGESSVHTLTIVAKYFRVQYTNGSSAQGEFRLQTLFHSSRQRSLTSFANQIIDKHNDTELTRMSNDFYLDVSQGVIGDIELKHLFGRNDGATTSIEDVWTAGGLYTWLTSAVTLEAISDDANDTVAGTGARVITVEGLDSTFAEISEDIDMNGVDATTATSNSFIRINKVYIKEAGAYVSTTSAGNSAGNIVVRTSSAGASHAEILHTSNSVAWKYGDSQVSRYTVPAGKDAYVREIVVNVEANKTADVIVWYRTGADTTSAPFTPKRVLEEFDGVDGERFQTFPTPIMIPEKSDIWASCKMASGTGVVNVDFEIILVAQDGT